MRRVLVTGGAGFIGSHLVDQLLQDGWAVTVVDNFDNFYDPTLKERSVASHRQSERFSLVRQDIRDLEGLRQVAAGEYDVIVHLAAMAGVRPSIQNPLVYEDVNVRGTQNLLELARLWKTPQFVFASSSSVYGVNPQVPWREEDHALRPISPYAATKVAGELLGHVYSHLFGIRFVALRFFTVYGPRQRPDLAIHKFARRMLGRERIPVYGDGTSRRDYTFVSDIVAGVRAAMGYTETMYEVVNLGNDSTVSVVEMIHALEQSLGVQASIEFLPPQSGDVPITWADIGKARRLLNYHPSVGLTDGIQRFAEWLHAEEHV